ncbi:hypothetical protein SH1V18_31490 [Vallitalea longa]|uniref:N-acetyltransferase domain-containing protein n=1 Tax=Vallitalea longa TaxID=2936439 RepID=A0A9W5YEW2_9FIRM|nr:N-acetyltransferase [Vallitalea longa]GKX30669.1 hypothetical protein SH1V18_31490 [Vallitalea longa]
MEDVYKICPVYKNEYITFRQTIMEDSKDLLRCYSDEKAVPLFNSDNCHGDDFYYNTLEKMKKAIGFWKFSYENRYFVRWTIILNSTNEIIGTIEMFHRTAEDEFNHYGVLRIDLDSKHENQKIIDAILEIVNDNFYNLFDVNVILTKAIPQAKDRILSLTKKGYVPLGKKFIVYDDYFLRVVNYLQK